MEHPLSFPPRYAPRTHRRYVGLATALVLPALLASCQRATPDAAPEGWRALFDGTSLEGWKMTGPGELALEDGVLTTRGGMGLLWYTREALGNCQLRVVFKLNEPDDNSGVFIRIPELSDDPWTAVHGGYEVQIANEGDDYHRSGCLYSISRAKSEARARVGDWSTFLITLDGPRTKVELDGELVTDFEEGDEVPAKKVWYEPERGRRPDLGYIGLQNHGDPARVQFKEVSVRALP